MTYCSLFWEFLKTGLFSIGGGMATLPFLYEIAARYDWFTTEELTNMVAVAESTPGPIGINMATYAGIRAAGIPGGMIATFALVLPSLIIIMLIAGFFHRYRNHRLVTETMSVVRPLSIGLIAAAFWSILRTVLFAENAISLGAMTVGFWCTIGLCAVLTGIKLMIPKIHPLVLVCIGAAGGILLKL